MSFYSQKPHDKINAPNNGKFLGNMKQPLSAIPSGSDERVVLRECLAKTTGAHEQLININRVTRSLTALHLGVGNDTQLLV